MNRFAYGKIGVAAICFNEELLIGAWLDHLLESNTISSICIVDCGSTDNTIEIIDRYKKTGRVFLKKTDWDKNFSSLRNQSLNFLKETAPDTVWAMWIDIDTFFNKNPDSLFKSISDFHLFMYDEVKFPSIRIWDKFNTIGKEYFCCEHWGLIRLSSLNGFVGNLHEQVSTKNSDVFEPTILQTAGVWLAHYDLPKLREQGKRFGVSMNMAMGLKKKRYLDIRKITDTLSPTDPDPDLMSLDDIETFGATKIEEEVNTNKIVKWSGMHSNFVHGLLV